MDRVKLQNLSLMEEIENLKKEMEIILTEKKKNNSSKLESEIAQRSLKSNESFRKHFKESLLEFVENERYVFLYYQNYI